MHRHTSKKFLESEAFPFYATPRNIVGSRRVKPHSHEFVELVYIVDGRGIHSYKGLNHPLGAGDAFIVEPGIEHSYQVNDGEHLYLYNILFQSTIFSHEIEQLSSEPSFFAFYYVVPFMHQSVPGQPSLWLASTEQTQFKQLLDDIIEESAHKQSGYRSMIRSKLVECFVLLSRCHLRLSGAALLAGETEKQAIEQIARFIERHYDKPLTLAEVSRLCGMSTSAFTEKFKAHMGQTFLEHRNQIRMLEAKRFLVQTDRKIIDISQNVGFDDVSLFNRTFRKWTGFSPSQYRKTYR